VFLICHAPLFPCLACLSVYLNLCASVVGCQSLFQCLLFLSSCTEFLFLFFPRFPVCFVIIKSACIWIHSPLYSCLQRNSCTNMSTNYQEIAERLHKCIYSATTINNKVEILVWIYNNSSLRKFAGRYWRMQENRLVVLIIWVEVQHVLCFQISFFFSVKRTHAFERKVMIGIF